MIFCENKFLNSADVTKSIEEYFNIGFCINPVVRRFKQLLISLFAVVIVSCSQPPPENSTGPLRISKTNPRYFTDKSGIAVYLTGSHTWNNLVEMNSDQSPERFDFEGFIEWMKEYNHNFIRLWAWELMSWDTKGNREEDAKVFTVSPQPWKRTGPGNALDGKPKFDLGILNSEYFKRLKDRVRIAADNGIYVSVMIFEGWGLQFSPNAYENHPFHPENNLNGISGDTNGDGSGVEIHTLGNDRITAIQELYTKKVIETVNEFDNVLFEISNENHPNSTEWQYHMIRFIKEIETDMPKQHPVGMTFQYRGGNNQTLFDSPADWISPNHEGGYRDDPPPGDGSKVVITDTDHLWGIGGNTKWVWKSFLRGLNPIFMDPYEAKVLRKSFDSAWVEPLRKSLGYTLMLSRRMDLINMVPKTDLATSGYCMANPGKEYLVYLPDSLEVTIDLTDFPGTYEIEWFDPANGVFRKDEIIVGGYKVRMTSPFETEGAVLHID
jgi:hypothetical protein